MCEAAMVLTLAVSYDRLAWLGAALIGGVLLLGAAVVVARRAVMKWLGASGREQAFSVEKLQELRDSGQISPEEFASLRRRALGLGPAPTGGPRADQPPEKEGAE
jgi:hypothetical protein